jgi:DNA-binding NarL/FixJ family response regulator
VAVVDDDPKTRTALRLLVDGSLGFACVGAFSSVEDALRRTQGETADVVLLGVDLPGNPLGARIGALQARFPDAAVLVLTVFEDDERVFRALCDGAAGYLLKKTAPALLLGHIREAASGGAPMSPEIATRVVQLLRVPAPRTGPGTGLTSAELDLLGLLVQGHSYQEAATRLGVTVDTVRRHVRAVYAKLRVHSKPGAVARASRAGLV